MPDPFKYLFAVQYADSSVYHQPPDDSSALDPARTAFFDATVLRDADGHPAIDPAGQPLRRADIAALWIYGQGHQYLVDLVTGHFEMDGHRFWVHDPDEFPVRPMYRPVYFRRKYQDVTVTGVVSADGKTLQNPRYGTGELRTGHYCIGWQTTVAGKNHRRILEVE